MLKLKEDIKDNKGKKILTVTKFNELVNSYAKRILKESEEEKQASNLHIEIEIIYKQLSQKYEDKTIFENTDIDSIYYVISKTCEWYYFYFGSLNGKSSKEMFFNMKKDNTDVFKYYRFIIIKKIDSIEVLNYFIKVFDLNFILHRHNILLLRNKTNYSVMEYYFNLIIKELNNKTIIKEDLINGLDKTFIKSNKFLDYLKLTNNLNLLDE